MFVYQDGKRTSLAIGSGDEGRAEAHAVAERINRWTTAQQRTLTASSPLPVDQALHDWLETYQPTLSLSYEIVARGLIEKHLEPHFGNRDLRDIREEDILTFAGEKLDAGKSLALVRNALSILRRVLNLYLKQGFLTANPLSRMGGLLRRMEQREAREVRQIDSFTR